MDLNVKYRTIKLLEDIIGENLDDLGYGNIFLTITAKMKSMKKITDKLYFIKNNTICFKIRPLKMKRQTQTDGIHLQCIYLAIDLYLECVHTFNNMKSNKKWTK